MEKLAWSATEYEEKDRSKDWFWALGVFIAATALASIIFENYFFAAVIVLGGGLLWALAVKKPEEIHYELSERGFKVKSRLYPYENIKSFWVRGDERPMLFIHSERFFLPVISAPIPEGTAETIRERFLSQEIPEEEMREHASEKIMESLGF